MGRSFNPNYVFDKEKNDELINILNEIGTSLDNLDNNYIIKQFDRIYSDNFRHSYAQISYAVYSLSYDSRDMLSYRLNEVISELIAQHKNNELIKKLKKLKDHIELEIMRFSIDESRDLVIQQTKKQYENLKANFEELGDKAKELEENQEKATTHSITILSIFAGIVFAFSGGFSLISTAVNKLNDISLWLIAFVVVLVGMLIFDIIFLFCFMIAKLTKSDISVKCLITNSKLCGDGDKCKDCKYILFNKYWYLFVSNILFIVMLVIFAALYYAA